MRQLLCRGWINPLHAAVEPSDKLMSTGNGMWMHTCSPRAARWPYSASRLRYLRAALPSSEAWTLYDAS